VEVHGGLPLAVLLRFLAIFTTGYLHPGEFLLGFSRFGLWLGKGENRLTFVDLCFHSLWYR